ncbi:MAG: PAS domain S-box protein [Chitinophagaceae bacterium]|nr:PAS domain S-box protein [Chitinophagaceae bacterium]
MTVFEKNKIDSPDHFAAIFSHATIGILVTDGKGSINAVNPYALDEFGYTEKELLGKRVETLIPSRYHAKHRHVHAAFSKQPECRNMGQNKCLFAIRKDGTEFPVEISFNKYVSGGSEYILSFITNITERKGNEIAISAMQTELESTVKARTLDLTRALRKLEQTNQKLSEATAFQKAVLDNAGAMIIVTDAKGVIKLCNPEAATSLGYEAEELIDKATPEIIHIPEELEIKKKILYEKYQFSAEHNFAALTELARRNIHNEEQYTYIRKDGSLFPVLLSITAIRNSDGVITGFMGVSVDISEWKRAEADLREALKKEKELNELKSRFLSMASHEFRSPLSTVLSSAYLIGKYASTEDQPRERDTCNGSFLL